MACVRNELLSLSVALMLLSLELVSVLHADPVIADAVARIRLQAKALLDRQGAPDASA
jgi:hypothetical protein